jgi:hypothetical protein
MPKTRSVPEVRGDKHAIIFMVEVFPAPLGPRNPKTSPFFTVKLIPSTAFILPNVFFRTVASIISGIGALLLNQWFGVHPIKIPP